MSLRIPPLRNGQTGAISQYQALHGEGWISANPRVTPVPPIPALSRRRTFQKERVVKTAAELRLKTAARANADKISLQTASVRTADPAPAADMSFAEFGTAPSTLALGSLTASLDKPRGSRTVPTRKTVMQLRMQNTRKLRKPTRALGKSGPDHDALPENDGMQHADNLTSDNTPTVHGPLDPALPVSKTDATRPYRLAVAAETARRQQVEKLFSS